MRFSFAGLHEEKAQAYAKGIYRSLLHEVIVRTKTLDLTTHQPAKRAADISPRRKPWVGVRFYLRVP
jgi:hypothetical protein